MALIALAAYIYSQSHLFMNLLKTNFKVKDKVGLILFFSTLSIIGTYTAVSLQPYALANTRPIGSFMAGYVGGPVVGLIVGALAGSHRFMLGGYTAFACALSTIVEGLMGAVARKYSKDGDFSILSGFVGTAIAEMLQMLIILTFARPLEYSVPLVASIGLPMILINSLGVAIFIMIIKNTREGYRRIGAVHSQQVLNIAGRTINYLRNGLDRETAKNVAEIICEIGDVKGAFVANSKELLANNGTIKDDAVIYEKLLDYYKNPDFRKMEFSAGERKILYYCVPIYSIDQTFEGVIGLQLKSTKSIGDDYFRDFAKELSELLSNQMEIYKLNLLAQKASVAEFKALRAQIEPHFLFNALNTIASFCRSNPKRARELIVDLSHYFRKTLNKREDFIPLREEMFFLDSYLSIEKARFGKRLAIEVVIPKELEDIKMPVYLLQPLIENSIKHGILPKAEGGQVNVKVEAIGDIVEFSVQDNGVGMSEKKVQEVTQNWPGIGLKNVNERLKLLYGDGNGLKISSATDMGTVVSFKILKEVIAPSE
ncbi:MAG: LytS/YhcK type 5TM receptor domain-containing protein [Clostridiaceae bacterium]